MIPTHKCQVLFTFFCKFFVIILFLIVNHNYMKNILLYLSAFIPMYALIMIKQLIMILDKTIEANFLNIFVTCFLFVVISLGALGLILETRRKQKVENIIITNKKNTTDEHFLGYFSLFVLFAITFDLSKISMLIVFVLILVMIGIVYVKNKLFYINPFLNILGFNFYDITYKTVEPKSSSRKKTTQANNSSTETSPSETKTTKIFFKGNLLLNHKYSVCIKDENSNFLHKSKK